MKKPIFVPCRTGYRVPHPLCRSLIVLIAGVFLTGVYFQAFSLVLRFLECFGDFRHDMQTPASDEKKGIENSEIVVPTISRGVSSPTRTLICLPVAAPRAITIRPSSATRSHSSRCCCSLQASLWFRFSSPALRLDSGLPYGTAASLLPYRSRS